MACNYSNDNNDNDDATKDASTGNVLDMRSGHQSEKLVIQLNDDECNILLYQYKQKQLEGTESIYISLVQTKDPNAGGAVPYALTKDAQGKETENIQSNLVLPKDHNSGGEVPPYALTRNALSKGTDGIQNILVQPRDPNAWGAVPYALTKNALGKETENIHSNLVLPKDYNAGGKVPPYVLTMNAFSKGTDGIQNTLVQPIDHNAGGEVPPYALTRDALSKGTDGIQNSLVQPWDSNAIDESSSQRPAIMYSAKETKPPLTSDSLQEGQRNESEKCDLGINPEMSALSSNVLKLELNESSNDKMRLYRCDLKTKIKMICPRSGVDVDGQEIFVENVSAVRVLDMNGNMKRKIYFNEVDSTWDVKVRDNLLYVCGRSMNTNIVLMMDTIGNIKSRIKLPVQEIGLGKDSLGLAVDGKTKDIYVSSANANIVYKCPQGSDHFKRFITHYLSHPTYICVDRWHDVVVSNTNSHTVSKYSSGGELIWTYGGIGSSNGHLTKPHGVCADPWRNIYVADKRNNRVVQISSDGEFLLNINVGETIEQPLAIAFRNYKLYISTGLKEDRAKENTLYVIKCLFE